MDTRPHLQQGKLILSNNYKMEKIDDLIFACKNHSQQVYFHIMNQDIESWLANIGESDLAYELIKIRESADNIEAKISSTKKAASFHVERKSFWEKLKEVFSEAQKKPLSFLLAGRAGVGKSSTINTLLGRKEANVGRFRPTTKHCKTYESNAYGINYTVVDTPGLADSQGQDAEYVNEIRTAVKEIDCLLFVTILGESRVRTDETETIRCFSSAFGPAIWERAVIVFTFADKESADEFPDILKERTELIQEAIGKYCGKEIAQKIPAIAVANDPKSLQEAPLPNGELWLGNLYTTVFKRISEKGMIPFLLATAQRLRLSTGPENRSTQKSDGIENLINITDAQRREIKQQVIRNVEKKINAGHIAVIATTGAAIGAALGPIGAVVGGAVGATMGLLAWIFAD